uniref:Uncharacterized protein n=1 Tax=Meloidogyne enterolobii TaxID=390850 RepID=A0A6V7VMU0_MELEN|nr:unnamed protein product [Meloidogyne enterolobii]
MVMFPYIFNVCDFAVRKNGGKGLTFYYCVLTYFCLLSFLIFVFLTLTERHHGRTKHKTKTDRQITDEHGQTKHRRARTNTDEHGRARTSPDEHGRTRTSTDEHDRTRTNTDEHGRARTNTDEHGRARTNTTEHGRTRTSPFLNPFLYHYSFDYATFFSIFPYGNHHKHSNLGKNTQLKK